MKIKLSRYWEKNCKFAAAMIVFVAISAMLFCLWSRNDEDYIMVGCALCYILVFLYLIYLGKKQARYILVEKDTLSMCLIRGTQYGKVNLSRNMYYEILPLTEGMYSTREFVILSNDPFKSFQKRDIFARGLAAICKTVEKEGKYIILPCDDPYVTELLRSDSCYCVGRKLR